jgi:hypothetical protein
MYALLTCKICMIAIKMICSISIASAELFILHLVRDVKLFVRDKNYSDNFKKNFETEAPFKIFDFIYTEYQ